MKKQNLLTHLTGKKPYTSTRKKTLYLHPSLRSHGPPAARLNSLVELVGLLLPPGGKPLLQKCLHRHNDGGTLRPRNELNRGSIETSKINLKNLLKCRSASRTTSPPLPCSRSGTRVSWPPAHHHLLQKKIIAAMIFGGGRETHQNVEIHQGGVGEQGLPLQLRAVRRRQLQLVNVVRWRREPDVRLDEILPVQKKIIAATIFGGGREGGVTFQSVSDSNALRRMYWASGPKPQRGFLCPSTRSKRTCSPSRGSPFLQYLRRGGEKKSNHGSNDLEGRGRVYL